ncbi:MAG: HDOD domain-containing protein [Campylobacterales bacterium]|nr:HDOD domain-containing protein [Campylobacterales bacterium]
MAYVPMIARVNSLPPLPESVLQLESLFAQNDPEITALVKIIESDPSLTADLLSKANAPAYGFTRQIVSVLQAVTLLGSAKIRALVLVATIQRNFNIDLTPYGIKTADFAKISTLQSELMFQWYMGIDVEKAKLLTPMAFLMETGKILISKELIERHRDEVFLADIHRYDNVEYVENIHVSMTTAQINALVFEHLKLSPLFIECMKYLDDEYEIPKEIELLVKALQIVRSAVNIREQLSDESIAQAITRAKEGPYDSGKFEKVAYRIRNKLEQQA